jgi:hypothetical protein
MRKLSVQEKQVIRVLNNLTPNGSKAGEDMRSTWNMQGMAIDKVYRALS